MKAIVMFLVIAGMGDYELKGAYSSLRDCKWSSEIMTTLAIASGMFPAKDDAWKLECRESEEVYIWDFSG